jgi:hypothetical protein
MLGIIQHIMAIPVKVWTGPEVSRGLSFPEFRTVGV